VEAVLGVLGWGMELLIATVYRLFFMLSTSHDFNACIDEEIGSERLQSAQSDNYWQTH
jgi:hypothetical protein